MRLNAGFGWLSYQKQERLADAFHAFEVLSALKCIRNVR